MGMAVKVDLETHAERPDKPLGVVTNMSRKIADTHRDPIEGLGKTTHERVLTVDELSDSLKVSAKTISRWRRQGLDSFRFICGGRRRVGFLQSSVDRFIRQNPQRIFRGMGFSRLTEEDREGVIDQARRLARAGGSPSEVTKRLARRTGRCTKTIRSALRQFDRDHPEAAIFPDHFRPPRGETRRKIFRQYRRGESVESLAKQFCRTKASVRLIIAQMRARWIMELPLGYIPNEEFARVRSEDAILGPRPPIDGLPRKAWRPKSLPPYLASLYEVPLLSRNQERHMFRKMNYLKYKASRLRVQFDPLRPSTRLMDRIERLYDESVGVKNDIVQANLRLVVSIAKRYASPSQSLFELVSDGNMTLLSAVEKFDFSRGNKFSTYATQALIKNFARSIQNESRQRDRFRSGHDDMLLSAEDERSDQSEQESIQLERESQLKGILNRLDERERMIIVHRFGLSQSHQPLTLKELGAMLHVSKERARQIEARAMSKLREAAREEEFEFSVIGQ